MSELGVSALSFLVYWRDSVKQDITGKTWQELTSFGLLDPKVCTGCGDSLLRNVP